MIKNANQMKTMTKHSCSTFSLLFFFAVVIYSLPLVAESPLRQQLMLMGGGVKTCSSTAPHHCVAGTEFPDEAKRQALFQFSQHRLEQILADPFQLISKENAGLLAEALPSLHRQFEQKQLTFSELKQAFEQLELIHAGQPFAGKMLYQRLSNEELDFMLDHLEVMVRSSAKPSTRLREHADLLQTNDPFSIDLYHRLVAEAQLHAGQEKPLILLVTASSRDPFAAVDFYLDALEQAGATVQWLPIHAAYQRSQLTRQGAEQDCMDLEHNLATIHGSYNRADVYPDLMAYQQMVCQHGADFTLALLEQADGILFNGGDQSLTLQALRLPDGSATKELSLIKQRLAAGQLIVAGTSAGTAVMSGSADQAVPMISNGDSAHALVYGAVAADPPSRGCAEQRRCPEGVGEFFLTYHATGGAALFPWGILDTHFSERGREGRLMQLAVATSTRYAFGVDEATALLVSVPQADGSVQFEVQGQGGVLMLDSIHSKQTRTAEQQAIQAVTTHYLTHGDTARLQHDELTFAFAKWKQDALESSAEPLYAPNILTADHYKQLAKRLCSSQNTTASGSGRLADHQFHFRLTEQPTSRQAHGYFPLAGAKIHYCSYQNVRVDITTRVLN